MIKYYEELENRKKYYLPLVDRYIRNQTHVDCNLPITFYKKYEELFYLAKKILKEIENINDELIYQKFKLGLIEYDELYCITFFNELKDNKEIMEFEKNMICNSAYSCIDYFETMIKILRALSYVFKEKKEYYKNLIRQYEIGLNEIKKCNTITYNNSNKIVKEYLPDIWYITAYNDLYNPTGPLGKDISHKEASLVYPYARVKDAIREKRSLQNRLNEIEIERLKIIKNNYITGNQFRRYLNYIYEIPVNPTMSNKNMYGISNTHIQSIVQIVKGIVSAEMSFYSFFVNLQKYTDNPIKELDKLIDMTNNDICDIFVRCCGGHKIDSMHDRKIVTSCLLYEKEFYNYINKNWVIDFISPIIINREKGIIEELNMNSVLVKKYLENNR